MFTQDAFNEELGYVVVPAKYLCKVISGGPCLSLFMPADAPNQTARFIELPANYQILFRLSEAKDGDYLKVVYRYEIPAAKRCINEEQFYYKSHEMQIGYSYLFAYQAMNDRLSKSGIELQPGQDLIVLKKVNQQPND